MKLLLIENIEFQKFSMKNECKISHNFLLIMQRNDILQIMG